jgi:radical SAM protein with 4Fe4S-binding SPASM domain
MDYWKIQEEKIKRLKKWIKNNEAGPLKLHFNLTDLCNLKCRFCWQRTNKNIRKENEISKERVLEILKEAKEMGVKEVFLSGGGEPLMKEGITDILIKIKELGFWGDMTTNGSLFNEELIKKLVEAKWNHINFSIDGNKKIHDYLRGKECFEKITNNIKLFNKYKKERNSEFPHIDIACVLCNKNYKVLPELAKIAKELEVENLIINPIKSYEGEYSNFIWKIFNNYYLNNRDINRINKIKLPDYQGLNIDTDAILKLENNSPNDMSNLLKKGKLEIKDKRYVCFEPFLTIVIEPNGYIGYCCESAGKLRKLNVKKDSLKEVWESDDFKKIRNSISKGYLRKECLRCGSWQIENNKIIKKLLKEK